MKVPQWFMPKKRLIKVAQDRLKETMQYVNIDNSVKKADKDILCGYQESLARFAQRHKVAVDFKSSTPAGNTVVDVYKTFMCQKAIDRMHQGNWYLMFPKYKSSANLSNDSKINLKDLKELIKNLAESEKTSAESLTYPQQIRHENKYYDYKR